MGQIFTRRPLAFSPSVSWLFWPLGLLVCFTLTGGLMLLRLQPTPDCHVQDPSLGKPQPCPRHLLVRLAPLLSLGLLSVWFRRRERRGEAAGNPCTAITEGPSNEAKHAQQALQQPLAVVLETLPAMGLVVDAEGRILYCNPWVEKHTGYRREELQGREWLTLFVPDGKGPPGILDATLRSASSEPGLLGTTIVTKDGDSRQIEWNCQTLFHGQTEPQQILAVGQDVTDLYNARARAVQAERLAAIGEMVTGLTHESGNALQRIQACLEMLALQVQDQPAVLDLVYRLQIAQNHLHQLYEEVRQYAAPIILRREPAHVSDVLQQAWEHLEPVRAGRVIEFCNQVHTNYVCRVDRYAMERVFRNILENALAAASDPVRIEILWRDAVLGKQPAVEIRLRDNGPGLNPEQKKRMFEPFYTTKTQSTGLGMAITKRLVEAHGGQIAVGEPCAPGAEIVVTLPKE